MGTGDVASSGERFSAEVTGFAKLALDSLEVPAGCVIVEDGNVITAGRDLTIETRNATRHAEIEALDVLLEQWQRTGLLAAEVAEKFSICSLYGTCEPCIMKINGGLKSLFSFASCSALLAFMRACVCLIVVYGLCFHFKCCGGITASKAISPLRNFYEGGNPNASKPHMSRVNHAFH
ncbi:hypothetical protein ACJRO7_020980 [Eucalyptus globulus]|uniref:CMP/dCMP-type deaminase domain-containing protein n=1 Tax=Eucalyptus globulus TaxID=34317 RepID=A0ABD3KMT1_EUCGL